MFAEKTKKSFKKVLFKKVVCILFVLTVAMVLHGNEAQRRDVITVGYSSYFSDFITEIDSRDAKGYGYEVFKKIEEQSDLRFEFVPVDGSLHDAVKDGLVDIAGFSVKTDERENEVAYTTLPFTKTYITLLSDDSTILYNNPSKIDKKTVASYEGNVAQRYLDAYCKRNNISVEYVYGELDEYMQLDTDFYIAYSEDERAQGKNNVLNLGVYNLYAVSSIENKALLDTINNYFLQVITTEGSLFWELEEKYLTSQAVLSHRSLGPNEVSSLRSRPLEVGYISDYNPISFINEQGEPDGALPETLIMLSEKFDFDVNFHPYSINDDISTYKDYDVLLTLYGDTTKVLEHYDATESYYTLPMFAQVPLDSYKYSKNRLDILQRSTKLGTLTYMSQDYNLFTEAFPHLEIVKYTDWYELLDAFEVGDVDLLLSTQTGSTFAELYLEDVESIISETDSNVEMRFLISKDISAEYVPIFNIMLDTISEVAYSGILTANTNAYYPEDTFYDYLQTYWYYYSMIIIGLVLAFVLFVYTQQKKKRKELTHAYNTDSLTGLMSMHKFREVVGESLKTAKANEYEIISFDVDMFKTINMYYSVEKGNEVICAIANSLKDILYNTPSYITRKTGDQFVLFRKVTKRSSLERTYYNSILPAIRNVIGENYHFSMSFGHILIEDCTEKVSTIIGYADSAKNQGKSRHENTFISFDEKMKKAFENKIAVTLRMDRALANNEFVVVYQPQINFNTLAIGGAEALVRWRPKGEAQIFPDSFIPVFEENGFIFQLDMYVLEEVCKFIVTNCRKMNIPRISINLSAHSILNDNIAMRIRDITSKHGVLPDEIELELTESAIIGDETTFIKKVQELKRLGFSISIDDFGAGVSSLNRLSAIEADVLKLDKAFFDVQDSEGKTNIVVADVITMAKHLNMQVVAEGVETLAQAKWLQEIECDYAQGYYFEKPIEKDEFIRLLMHKKVYELKATEYSSTQFTLVS